MWWIFFTWCHILWGLTMCMLLASRWVLHFTQCIPLILTYVIPPSWVNMKTAVCKGEALIKAKLIYVSWKAALWLPCGLAETWSCITMLFYSLSSDHVFNNLISMNYVNEWQINSNFWHTATAGTKCTGCERFVKGQRRRMLQNSYFEVFIGHKAKCFGRKKKSGDSVARTGSWGFKTSWECSYIALRCVTMALRHIEICAFWRVRCASVVHSTTP